LFDRENDPYEMYNLAGRPAFAAVQASLQVRLRQWMADTGDPFDSGERDPDTGMLCLGQKFVDKE
jgi:hypothetical protein